MNSVDSPPPANRQCQIYVTNDRESAAEAFRGSELYRCGNEGTHWEKWGGCGCEPRDDEICEGDYFSWECSGDHVIQEVLDGAA